MVLDRNIKKRVGLALGSGGARGMAHVGVLEVLEKEQIPIDMIAGSSAGALVGAFYAQGIGAREIRKIMVDASWGPLLPMVDLTISRSGLIEGRRVRNWLKENLGGDLQFSNLKIPFACVATDIMTGEEVLINKGSVLEAVRASISVPGVFTVNWRDGRFLADGGLTNPVPVNIVKNMGAEFVIAVDVIPDLTPDKRRWLSKKGGLREPGIIEVLMQSLYITSHALAETSARDADVVIKPQVAHIFPGDFHRTGEAILSGELAALDAMPGLKKKLAAASSGK